MGKPQVVAGARQASTAPTGEKMFKTVLIGDGSVGKTSIRRRYLGDGFASSYLPTIGVDFSQTSVVCRGVNIRLVIWDLAGQTSFERVRRHYYKGCHSIILVYSVVDRESFDNASKWLVEAFHHIGRLPPTAVLGNKTDLRASLPPDSVVTSEEGEKFAALFTERMEIPVFFKETSALTGDNIQETFAELSEIMMAESQSMTKTFRSV